MLFATILSALAVSSAWIPGAAGDADFKQVRRRVASDHSARRNHSPQKYFHEALFHPHYDGRFAAKALPYDEQQDVLKSLVKSYLATFADLRIETWLMHGSLLGWWWGQKVLPWDTDVDVQVTEASMQLLASYYNMSTFHFKKPEAQVWRSYLLEVNPNYINREQTDKLNVIDARWIDMDSGMFIDITTVRYNLTHPEGEGILSCKDGHEFRDTYLFPLIPTTFEGSPVNIPYKYQAMLESEYGADALENTRYHNHIFDEKNQEWTQRLDINAELR